MTKTPKHTKHLDFDAMCAKDVMQRELVTVRVSDTLEEVERILADSKISGVPVVDENDRVLGVLSASDLVDRYADGEETKEERGYAAEDDDGDEEYLEREDDDGLCAGDVMTPEIESIDPDTSLRQVAKLMVSRRIHRLLVVQKGKLVGIVSTLDVMRAVADAG
ncbi:MAG: CBS domain-containing protein [Planctomycetota bacterium]